MQIAFISLIFLTLLNISITNGNDHEDVTKCQNSLELEFWLTKIGLGTISDNQLGQQFACALSEQQQLLETLHENRIGNINSDALMSSTAFSKRYLEFKNRMEFIRNNDPEMAKVLEELIGAEIQAKRVLQNKDPAIDSVLIQLKDKLVYAAHFIANYQQISAAEIAPLKGIDIQELVKELIELRNQVESNKHENGHSKKGERCDDEHYSREKRMLQLVITSIDEGEGMPKGPYRRRQRKRLNIYWTIVIIGCCVIWLCACIYNGCLRKRPNQQNGGAEQKHSSDSHVVNMGS